MKTVMPNPAPFYVTAIDGPRVHTLAGPFETYEDARAAVEPVRRIACDFERNASAGRAWFMAYGVTRASVRRETILGVDIC